MSELDEHIKKKTVSQKKKRTDTETDDDGGLTGLSREQSLKGVMWGGVAAHLVGVLVTLTQPGLNAAQLTAMGNTFLIFGIMYLVLFSHEEQLEELGE